MLSTSNLTNLLYFTNLEVTLLINTFSYLKKKKKLSLNMQYLYKYAYTRILIS